MACTTLTTILKGCDNNMGGITSIYINDMENLGTLTVDTNNWEWGRNVLNLFSNFKWVRPGLS